MLFAAERIKMIGRGSSRNIRGWKMKCFCVFSAFALLIFASGCNLGLFNPGEPGSGVSKTEVRKVEPFDSIEFTGAGDIQVTCGSPASLSLTADDNLLEYLATQVVGGTLKISTTKSISPTKQPTFAITVEDLKELSLSGSGNVVASKVSGDQTSFTITGSGKIMADGEVDKLDITINGSGSADLDGVAAKQATIAVNGSGDIKINASEVLDVNIAGSGDVEYRGSPEIRKNIAGSGKFRRVEK